MFNHIATSVILFGIIVATYPNIAVASSNEQVCKNAVKQKLQETDFGLTA